MAIRVLVVDDSAFMRRVISDALSAEPDMELVGTAINGLDALIKVEQLQPDVVTLDVEMPEMDGLTALRHLMARYPRPVVMLSSLTQAGAVTTIRALTIGAVDFIGKPSGAISLDFHRVREELVQKIRLAARAKVRGPGVGGRGSAAATAAPSLQPLVLSTSPRPPTPNTPFDRLVVIGSSTGGPRALGTLVPALPNDGRTAYLIVQHMPAGFTRSLAERLDSVSALTVREAEVGDHLAAGTALVAPGDFHLRVTSRGTVQLDQEPKVHGVRPSVDVTLYSVAPHFGSRTVAAILTGMGSDGAAGAAAIRAAGGLVLAEDESTCVVWGMPRAVVERGGADRVVPLDEMGQTIAQCLIGRAPSLARAGS
jgi:two-component system, chemotaxis family, protein-glutamate methylesterase/glutaminase